jgi:hypothetical protein
MEAKAQVLDISQYSYFSGASRVSNKRHETLKDMTINIAIVAIPAIIAMAFSLVI